MDLGLTPRHQRLEQQPRGAAEDSHHSSRASSRPSGRNGSTATPASSSHRTACRIARRVSASTGTIPSSSKKPTRRPDASPNGRSRPKRQAERHRVPIRIADVGAGHHLEQQLHVVDCSRHRADDAGEGERAAARREVPGGRHAARRGLEAADAAEVRRHANRSAAVAADAACRQARGDGRGLAAARSARRAIERPRAVGAAVERVVGFPRHQLLGDVGDAEDDGAGGAESCDQRGVGLAADARAKARAGLEGQAGDGDGALDADRARPAEGGRCLPAVALAKAGCRVHAMCLVLSRARVGQRAIGVEADVGVERRIERLDALQVRLDEFHRRDLLRAHQPRHFGCAAKTGIDTGTVYLKCCVLGAGC